MVIDYGDLCEDLKVRFKLGWWGHPPSCPERVNPSGGPMETDRAWKKGQTGKGGGVVI